MSTQLILGEIYIGRNSNRMISIDVKDQSSNTRMLSIQMTPDEFAMLITGATQHDLNMTVKDLDLVGKYRVREARQIVCPTAVYDNAILEQWLIDNAQEDGWILDSALRSQSSVRRVGNESILSYSVHKYTDTPQGD